MLFLPHWATDYLKRRDPALAGPLALYERIKGGMRLVAVDPEARQHGVRPGQSVADARALLPPLTLREIDYPLLEAGFGDLADWHSNASPLVAILTDRARFGDLVLDITGVSHLFGGEAAMLELLLQRLRACHYSVAGAIAPTIGAAWALSHFARSQVAGPEALSARLDPLPVAALRLDQNDITTLSQMGLTTIGQVRSRPRKPLQARFGAELLLRLDQAYGEVEERMTSRLPPIAHSVERRLLDPLILLDDVLAVTQDLAIRLAHDLERHGRGAQTFHLLLYRVDHKVMTLSLNAARPTRDPAHMLSLFRHRAQRLAGEYDAGFGIDMVRLAAGALEELAPTQLGAFSIPGGMEDIDRLTDRLSSRLGAPAVLRTQLKASHIPERAARLVPAIAASGVTQAAQPSLTRPLRLLPSPEPVAINAEVPDGLPASMIWRRQRYRLIRGAGPERLGAEWWRSGERLELVPPPASPDPAKAPPEPPPYIPDLKRHDPEAQTRDYYRVEDEDGRRFWVFRLGLYGGPDLPVWYLHGFFA